MNNLNYEVVTRPGLDPATAVGKPPLPPKDYIEFEEHGLSIQRNVPVMLRDGVSILIDIYRPASVSAPLPILLVWGPYGKHNQKDALWPGAGIEPGWMSPLTGFEAPDPMYWCQHDYAVVYADPRGMWHSEGNGVHNGPQEAEDVYDAIQWLGDQPWSNGRVGMLGVSYLAGIQYIAGAMQPPALKAISPWECFSDWYREFCFHGGIPETGFIPRAATNMRYSYNSTEDTAANVRNNPLLTDYYKSRYPDLSRIEVPVYVVASWSDHGLHTRGTLEAYEAMSSPEKWLEVHAEKKWSYFYKPENVEKQRVFFDYYLHDRGEGPMSWPRVRMQVQNTGTHRTIRTDIPWPVPDTQAVRLYADFGSRTLENHEPTAVSTTSFDPTTEQVDLEYVFDQAMDVIGSMRLRLHLRADDADDADVFIAVRKISADGTEQRFPFNALFEDGPVALGWLRASHQDVLRENSTELKPVHRHESEKLLQPGEIRSLDIEIWPTATSFATGDRLVVTILGRDFIQRPEDKTSPVIRHEDLRNQGTWTLTSEPDASSYLSLAMYPTA